jgi:hypothetical protein
LFHDFPHVHPGCVMLENQCYKHKRNSATLPQFNSTALYQFQNLFEPQTMQKRIN